MDIKVNQAAPVVQPEATAPVKEAEILGICASIGG